MISVSKTYPYVAPESKVIELNARGAFLVLSTNNGSYQNEQLDNNPSGFDDDFWN